MTHYICCHCSWCIVVIHFGRTSDGRGVETYRRRMRGRSLGSRLFIPYTALHCWAFYIDIASMTMIDDWRYGTDELVFHCEIWRHCWSRWYSDGILIHCGKFGIYCYSLIRYYGEMTPWCRCRLLTLCLIFEAYLFIVMITVLSYIHFICVVILCYRYRIWYCSCIVIYSHCYLLWYRCWCSFVVVHSSIYIYCWPISLLIFGISFDFHCIVYILYPRCWWIRWRLSDRWETNSGIQYRYCYYIIDCRHCIAFITIFGIVVLWEACVVLWLLSLWPSLLLCIDIHPWCIHCSNEGNIYQSGWRRRPVICWNGPIWLL